MLETLLMAGIVFLGCLTYTAILRRILTRVWPLKPKKEAT